MHADVHIKVCRVTCTIRYSNTCTCTYVHDWRPCRHQPLITPDYSQSVIILALQNLCTEESLKCSVRTLRCLVCTASLATWHNKFCCLWMLHGFGFTVVVYCTLYAQRTVTVKVVMTFTWQKSSTVSFFAFQQLMCLAWSQLELVLLLRCRCGW